MHPCKRPTHEVKQPTKKDSLMALSFFLGKGGQSYNALEQRGRCFAKNRVAFPNKPQEIEQCCKTSPVRLCLLERITYLFILNRRPWIPRFPPRLVKKRIKKKKNQLITKTIHILSNPKISSAMKIF